jgi:hypothetical protein
MPPGWPKGRAAPVLKLRYAGSVKGNRQWSAVIGVCVLSLALGCGTDSGSGKADAPAACQGDPAYCERPYNQVAQLCTHNAMASEVYEFYIPTPNQAHSLTRQLEDGVRCLMLDTYRWSDDLYLCHIDCDYGSLPLADGLAEVRAWMDKNPREIVTFILESYISEEETFGALVESGLAHESGEPTSEDLLYYHDAPPGSPWPTMGWMIENEQRLVVLSTDDAANGRWHLDWRAYGWETPYDDPTFTCKDARGDPKAHDNALFILNHYTLCWHGGCEENGLVNNTLDFIVERAVGCWQKHPDYNPWQQIPTFVNLDQYHVPGQAGVPQAALAVKALNALWPNPPAP